MSHRFSQPKGVAQPDDICLDCGIKRDGSLGKPCRERVYDYEDAADGDPAAGAATGQRGWAGAGMGPGLGPVPPARGEPAGGQKLGPSGGAEKIPPATASGPSAQEMVAEIARDVLSASRPARTPMERMIEGILAQCRDTFMERNAVYGDNYAKVGKIMRVLFPEGLELKTEADHNKYHLFSLAIVKLTRYAANYEEGHKDSLLDQINYYAMVATFDF